MDGGTLIQKITGEEYQPNLVLEAVQVYVSLFLCSLINFTKHSMSLMQHT